MRRKDGLPKRTRWAPAEDRFWSNVLMVENCWEWIGARSLGYGHFHVDGREVGAHRYAYELRRGPIPEGLQIDHLCRNRGCVNPDHMEPVTQRENLRRGDSPIAIGARRTHCLYGHPLDAVVRHANGRQARRCQTCHRERERARKRTLR